MKFRMDANIKEVKWLIGEMKKQTTSMEKPLKKWGDYLFDETNRQFLTETDPDGKPWAQLSPAYKERKMKKYPQSKILTASGAMRRSLYSVVGAYTLEIGLRSKIAEFHQEGTRKMPQRKIIGLSEKRTNEGIKIIWNWLVEVL